MKKDGYRYMHRYACRGQKASEETSAERQNRKLNDKKQEQKRKEKDGKQYRKRAERWKASTETRAERHLQIRKRKQVQKREKTGVKCRNESRKKPS